MRRGARPLLPVLLLTTLVAAGCGSTDGGRTASAPASPGDARIVRTAVTDGHLGEAVTGRDAGPLRELSRGGRPDASEPRRGGGERAGVGAADACPDADLMPAPGNLARVEAVTLCLLNGVRADNGLPPLATNPLLARAAAGHAADMVARSYFAHESLDGSDIRDRIGATGYLRSDVRWVIGENLAWGTGALATPKSIVNAWMNSEGHRANVLHPEYREIGFGIVAGNPRATDGFGATYATDFGLTSAPVPASAPAPAPAATPTPAAKKAAAKKAAAKKAAALKAAARKRAAARKAAARARAAKRARRPVRRRPA